MENWKDFFGCRCHAADFFLTVEKGPEKNGSVPAHTFPWAKTNYIEDRPVQPLSQVLDLVLDIDKKELSGSNTIKCKVVQKSVQSIQIDAVDLKIHSIFVHGKSVKYSVGEKITEIFLQEPLERGNTVEIKITYSCSDPKAGIYFISPDKEYPQRPVQVWTQGQDDDARFWFPSFDDPRLKCTVELRVEVPAQFLAISNGTLVNESRGGKTWTFHWKSGALIPSYLVTLAVGRFSEVKEDWRGKPVTYYVEKGREAEARISFGKTPQMIDLFSRTIGIDYPYEKYAQVAVAEFMFGGMENTSATTQTDTTLHPLAIEEDFTSDDLVSHELAHQWFGDLVTCRSWTHGWLNEGWATFMETVFKEHDLGAEDVQYYRHDELGIYIDEDARYRRPIVTSKYADPAEIWDRHTYQKAGLILNMLRSEVGADDFWLGTKNYLNSFKGGAVETIDFQRALESASGKSLDWFFDQWFYKAGYPELKAVFEWDEKSKTAKFTISQIQKISELTPLFKLNSKIEFFFEKGKPQSFELSIDKSVETFVFSLGEKPLYCHFDGGNHLLKSLEWALPLDMVRKQLELDSDVVGKIWAMKALEKQASKEGVEAIVRRLQKDPFWGVRAEAAVSLGEVKTHEAMQALIDAFKGEKKSRVRARICSALGKYRDDRSAETLSLALSEDSSPFVKAAAAAALGKTKNAKAFDVLEKATRQSSWNDIVASSAYTGLRNLRDPRALPLFIEGAKYGNAKFARVTSVAALSEYGLDKPEVTEFLKECLEDKFFRLRFAAADALARRKDLAAAPALDEAAHRYIEGHLKAATFRAASRLRDSMARPQELIEMKESIDKLLEENRKLRDRVTRLE